jgi:CHASE2 domain-containing sensor protein
VTRSRHISRDTRSGILVGIGATLVLAPLAVGLSLGALVAGVIIGAVTIGLGIAGTGGSGRGTLPGSASVSG